MMRTAEESALARTIVYIVTNNPEVTTIYLKCADVGTRTGVTWETMTGTRNEKRKHFLFPGR